jgi:hypothetical protein
MQQNLWKRKWKKENSTTPWIVGADSLIRLLRPACAGPDRSGTGRRGWSSTGPSPARRGWSLLGSASIQIHCGALVECTAASRQRKSGGRGSPDPPRVSSVGDERCRCLNFNRCRAAAEAAEQKEEREGGRVCGDRWRKKIWTTAGPTPCAAGCWEWIDHVDRKSRSPVNSTSHEDFSHSNFGDIRSKIGGSFPPSLPPPSSPSSGTPPSLSFPVAHHLLSRPSRPHTLQRDHGSVWMVG